MLRQAVRLVPLATRQRAVVYFGEPKPMADPEDTLTKKWLKGLFDEEDTKPREEKSTKKWNKDDDDDSNGGVMMPIPPGLAGLYFFQGHHKAF